MLSPMRRPSRKALLVAVAAVASGLFLRLAFPPFAEKGAGVVWAAPIPVFLAARLLRPRRAAQFGFLWGFAFWVSALTWFVPLVDNGGPWPLVLLGEVGLSAWCALFPALAAGALSRLWGPWRRGRAAARAANERLLAARADSPEEDAAFEELRRLRSAALRREIPMPLAAALLWAGSEWLRATVGGGFSWYSLGAGLAGTPVLAQLAAAGGVWLVSALVALLADALAGVLLRLRDTVMRVAGSPRRHLDLSLAMVVLLLAWIWGGRHLRAVRAAEREAVAAGRVLHAAGVNPGLPCIFTAGSNALWEEGYARLGESTRTASAFLPDLIVWPETSLWTSLPDKEAEERLCALSREWDAPVLAGSTRRMGGEADEGPHPLVQNAAWLFSANGVSEPYVKCHLIPFGEYVPLDEAVPALRALSPSGMSCAFGEGPVLLSVPYGAPTNRAVARVSPLICFEDTVPAVARRAARGADALVSMSNDAWFEGSCEALQHHAEASFRAIENGLPLLRVSNHGVTAVVRATGETSGPASREGFGRRFRQTGTGVEPGFFVDAVPLPAGVRTPYARFGDWIFGIPCAAFLLAVLACGLRRRAP